MNLYYFYIKYNENIFIFYNIKKIIDLPNNVSAHLTIWDIGSKIIFKKIKKKNNFIN